MKTRQRHWLKMESIASSNFLHYRLKSFLRNKLAYYSKPYNLHLLKVFKSTRNLNKMKANNETSFGYWWYILVFLPDRFCPHFLLQASQNIQQEHPGQRHGPSAKDWKNNKQLVTTSLIAGDDILRQNNTFPKLTDVR